MENEDVIREQMEETRTSLTEKVEALEQKVVNKVQETTEAVAETVTTVKESVQESVETVKHWLDIKGHVQEHPWAMVGGSLAVGFVAGALVPEKVSVVEALAPAASPKKLHHNGGSVRRTQQAVPATSWLSQFEPELAKLKHLALGAALGTIREMISSNLPPEMGHQVRELIDNVTTKIGGEPLPSSDLANLVKGFTDVMSQGIGQATNTGQPQQEQTGPASEHTRRFTMQ